MRYIKIMIFAFVIGFFLVACDNKTGNAEQLGLEHRLEGGDTVAEESNRKIIANALGLDESNRKIRFILASIESVDAGKLTDAMLTEEDGESTLDITLENSTKYRVYLSRNYSVEGIKDLESGDWLIKSQR